MESIFISYCSSDRSWAEWIAWVLEEAGFSILIQAWDFLPGHNFVLKMHKAVESADRVIAVLSPNFLNSKYPQSEWSAAFAKDPEGKERKLLMVCVQECNLPGILKQIVRIDLYKNCENESQAAQSLLYGLSSGRKKPEVPPAFPGVRQRSVSKKPNFPKDRAPGDAQNRKKYVKSFRSGKGHPVKAAMGLMFLFAAVVFTGSPTISRLNAVLKQTANHIYSMSVQRPGAIVFPVEGAVVSGHGTVQFRISLLNTYAAVVIRPRKDGQYWIQNDGLTITSSNWMPVPVFYGGRDQYQIFLGVTHDPNLFQEGDKLAKLPLHDRYNRPVIWIGPVNVRHL